MGQNVAAARIFYIFFLYFAKINGLPEILQKYTFAAAAHDGRIARSEPVACDGHTAVTHGGRDITLSARRQVLAS
jgi:hypothetical protein